jgi:hypothetical protein
MGVGGISDSKAFGNNFVVVRRQKIKDQKSKIKSQKSKKKSKKNQGSQNVS